MATIEADFDLGLYPASAVMAAAHHFSGTHKASVTTTGNATRVLLKARTDDAPDVTADLSDAVIDETLRAMVRARTQTLHDVLVRAAFDPIVAP